MKEYEKLQAVREKMDWSTEEFLQFMREVNSYTKEVINGTNMSNSDSEEDSEKYSDEERFIFRILAECGIPMSIKGYFYIKTAILLCIEDSGYLDAITKRLYPQIAKQHETTANSVERAIRHAVTVAWDNGNQKFYKMLFSYSIPSRKAQPTNAHFIATLTEYIKMNLPKWKNETWTPKCF